MTPSATEPEKLVNNDTTTGSPDSKIARNKKALIITTTSVIAGVAIIAGGTAFVINGINNGTTITPGAISTSTTSAAPADGDQTKAAASAQATEGKKVGDELTAEQAAAVAKNWDGDFVAYKTTDGKFLLVSRSQALPEAVRADAGKKLSAAAIQAAAVHSATNIEVEQMKGKLTYDTGHQIVLVAHVYAVLDPNTGAEGWTWMNGTGVQYPDAASATAAIQAQADAAGATIVVSQ